MYVGALPTGARREPDAPLRWLLGAVSRGSSSSSSSSGGSSSGGSGSSSGSSSSLAYIICAEKPYLR